MLNSGRYRFALFGLESKFSCFYTLKYLNRLLTLSQNLLKNRNYESNYDLS